MLGLKEYIWQKKKISEKGYGRVKRNIDFSLAMFVNIKEVHPRERNLNGEKNNE